MNYQIIYDVEEINNQFSEYSPFNYKKDTNGITEEEIIEISNNLKDELIHGPHPPVYSIIYSCKYNHKVNCSKIRVGDKNKNVGKSNGYRCVLLIDETYRAGFILHIYSHSFKNDLTSYEKKKLKQLVDTYYEDVYVKTRR